MSLLHPALLFGLALAVVPIALHLLLRAKPKRLVFPALRLLQQRRMQNVRRLQLRHLWLLLLRTAVILLIVVALARPSLPPANYAPTWMEIALFAGVVATALSAYFAIMTLWSRQPSPRHVLLTRRTMLRGGLTAATVVLVLLIVGWPYQRRVAAEISAPAPAVIDNLPVAALFLCDTSLSLEYQYQGRSRLEAARTIAADQLAKLPPGSKVAVFDAAGELPPLFTADLTAAQNRLEGMATQPVVMSLNDRLSAAIRFQDDDRRRTLGEQATVAESRRQDRYVREIYLLTDLAKSAWRSDDSQSLATELKDVPWLGLYVIDVGVESPTNQSVVDVRPSRATVGEKGSAAVEATLRTLDRKSAETLCELWSAENGGKPVKRDQQTVSFSQDGQARVRFPIDDIGGRLFQGELRLVTSDPLGWDNTGFFTIRVLEPLEILVVAQTSGQEQFWLRALQELESIGSPYRANVISADSLAQTDLKDYEVVCLINLARPSRELWDKLGAYVEDGGGIAVFLGANSTAAGGTIDPVSYNSAEAQRVLAVELKASLHFSPARHLDFRGSSHPLTGRLETLGVLAELADVDFVRYWRIEPRAGAAVLARWTDDNTRPALVLGDRGRGRCLVFGSSVDSTAWSGWPRNWTYLAIADQWLQLLSRQAASEHTYEVGLPIVIPASAKGSSADVLLRLPDLTQRRFQLGGSKDLVVNDVTAFGQYQVARSDVQPVEILTGFSINPPHRESDLTRLTHEDLDQLLGADRYGLARDPQELSRSVLAGRIGQEVMGLLMACLVGVFVLEQLTAAWFYREEEPA